MQRETGIFYCSILLLVLLAYFIQTYTLFSPDVGYLLHAANQMLAGGKYGHDIFETNPPMILYLYFPACLLAKWSALSLVTAVRIYVISLAVVSLGLCFFLLKKIIQPQDKITFYFLFYSLVFCMLFFPSFDFAQREHILMIFIMPYLLSAALKLEDKTIPRNIAILIGLLAGLGFALKPFFLVTPILIELYFIIKKRRLFARIRIESVVIISVLLLYLVTLFLKQPDYINIVLPLVMRYYFPATVLPWYKIIVLPNVIFCIGMLVSYLFYYKHDRYSTLGWVIELALLGMIIAFCIPQTPWWYHVLPALFLALFLLALFIGQSISSLRATASGLHLLWGGGLFLLVGVIIVLLLPLTCYYAIWKYVYHFQYHQVARKNITNYINQHSGHHSIACIGLDTQICFPLVLDTESNYAERFPSFWWYHGLRMLEKNSHSSALLQQVSKDKLFLIENFADDLERYKARWVIVDMPHFQRIETPTFDILNYLSENKKFRAAWRHYRYLVTIDSIKLYGRIT